MEIADNIKRTTTMLSYDITTTPQFKYTENFTTKRKVYHKKGKKKKKKKKKKKIFR